MYPEPGGLTFEELERLLTGLCGTGRDILGLDVCCYHPALDAGGRGAGELARVISVVAPGPRL
jgi:arginase family enzyme